MKGTWDLDRDPLAALREGKRELFEEFVRTEFSTFRGFFERLGAGSQEAEDLAQEVLLKLYRGASRYQPRSQFTAFAMRVARNVWIDNSRRRAARPALRGTGSPRPDGEGGDLRGLEAAVEGREAEPSSALSIREEAGRLRRALAELTEGHRMVFEMAVVQGLPYAEIADALEIPVGTVKSRVFHAVRKLRAAIGHREGEVRP